MDILYAAQRAAWTATALPPWWSIPRATSSMSAGGPESTWSPSSGKVNINVFAMAREGLREELGVAIHNAATRKTPFTASGVRVKSNGGSTTIDLTVKPLADPAALRGMLMVVFEETAAEQPHGADREGAGAARPAGPPNELEEELRHTRERLQTTVEEMQAAQEELRSTNEELQSNNEELQSTNEELNSSKEELQSLNEEMQTVNAELQSKIGELSQSNSDMKNLLNGIEIATIFLDNDLGVKRFTPAGQQDRPPGRRRRGAADEPLRHEPEIRPAGRGRQGGARHAGAQRSASRGRGRPLVQHAHSALPHRGQCDRRRGDDVCRHHGA